MFTTDDEGTPGSTVSERGERSRNAILQAALELHRAGPTPSLRDVARRTGYSPGALYRYFEGKEGLIRALADEADRRAAERLGDVSPDLSPRDRLIRLGLAYVAFGHYEPSLFSLLLQGRDRPPGQVYGAFLESARSGVESGALRAGKGQGAEAIAYSIWSLSHGMAVLSFTGSAVVDLDVEAAQREAIAALVGAFGSNT